MSTSTFSYSQLSGGVMGMVNLTADVTKVYSMGRGTHWAGWVTGTQATMEATCNWGNGTTAAPILVVSVDGAAFANPVSVSGTTHLLYTALTDVAHFVIVSFVDSNAAVPTGLNSYWPATGTVLSVTGAVPAIAPFAAAYEYPYSGGVSLWSCASKASASGYLPALTPTQDNNTMAGSGVVSGAFKTTSTALYFLTYAQYIFVAINGGVITRYDTTVTDGRLHLYSVTGLSSSMKLIQTWCSHAPDAAFRELFVVGVDTSFTASGITKRLDQYGDSITYGLGSTSTGDVDVFRVAVSLGYVASTYGISGETSTATLARLPSCLAAKTTDLANDVAVIMLGNNMDGGWTTQYDTDYTACMVQLRTKYSKVLVRAMIPVAGNARLTGNARIQGLVTALADPNVIFITSLNWPNIDAPDGTHPTDAGYVTLAKAEQTQYAAAIFPDKIGYVSYDYSQATTGIVVSDTVYYAAGQPILVYSSVGVANAYVPIISDTSSLTWTLIATQMSTYTTIHVWKATPIAGGSTVITVNDNAVGGIFGVRVTLFTSAGIPRVAAQSSALAPASISQTVSPTSAGSYLSMYLDDAGGGATAPSGTAGTGCTLTSSSFVANNLQAMALEPIVNPLPSSAAFTLAYTARSGNVELGWIVMELPSLGTILPGRYSPTMLSMWS